MTLANKWSPFLYRRLGRWITCQLRLDDESALRLRTKFDVASFGDVFAHPFYWQAFHLMHSPPALVLDCGANCGHFTILAHYCIKARFPGATPSLLLIEPNPLLASTIRRNLQDNHLLDRSRIERVLLGKKQGTGTLWVSPKEFLGSRQKKFAGAKPYDTPYAQLESLVGDLSPDLVKIDIEGGEFDLIKTQIDFFRRVGILFLEAHGSPAENKGLIHLLESVGLRLAMPSIAHYGYELLAFNRPEQ